MIKRYIWLLSLTAAAIAGILAAARLASPEPPAVQLYEVETMALEETVSCSGRIESADSETVTLTLPCVVSEVLVESGGAVEAGAVLFTIDREATREVIATAGGIDMSLVGDDLIPTEVTAPVSGIITKLNVAAGDMTGANQDCAVIASNENLQVKVTVHENKLKDIQIGQEARVSGSAFSLGEYKGIVTYISPSARQQYVGTNSETVVDVVVSLSQIDSSLKPGLTAKTVIRIGEASERLLVPYSYVLQDDLNREYVYVYSDGRAVKRLVETGREMSRGFEILSGLSAGERVVANPDAVTRAGMRVQLEAAKEEGTPGA